MEETRNIHSQHIRDEEKGCCETSPSLVRDWARQFSSLMNSKSDRLDPGITMRLSQQPTAYDVGVELAEENVAATLRRMAKSKIVGPDGLPVDALKLGPYHDRTIFQELHRLITLIWQEVRAPQQ